MYVYFCCRLEVVLGYLSLLTKVMKLSKFYIFNY